MCWGWHIRLDRCMCHDNTLICTPGEKALSFSWISKPLTMPYLIISCIMTLNMIELVILTKLVGFCVLFATGWLKFIVLMQDCILNKCHLLQYLKFQFKNFKKRSFLKSPPETLCKNNWKNNNKHPVYFFTQFRGVRFDLLVFSCFW